MFGKFLLILLLAAIGVAMVARVSRGAGPERTYVVQPTDTLWTIAAHSYAGDVREGVWKLQQRNHLASATIRPGQRLVLPGS
jgi:LysM repeat protein